MRATYCCRQQLGKGKFLFLRGPKDCLEKALNLINSSSQALNLAPQTLPRGARQGMGLPLSGPPTPWTTTEREQHRASLPRDGVIEHLAMVVPRTPPREHRKEEEGTSVSEAPDTSTTRSNGEPTSVSGLAQALTDSGVWRGTNPHTERRTSLLGTMRNPPASNREASSRGNGEVQEPMGHIDTPPQEQ